MNFFKHHEIDKGPFQFIFNVKNNEVLKTPILNVVYITVHDSNNELIYIDENIIINLNKINQSKNFNDSNNLHVVSFGEFVTRKIDGFSTDEEYLLSFAYIENDDIKIIKVNYKIWSYYLDEYASAFHYWSGF